METNESMVKVLKTGLPEKRILWNSDNLGSDGRSQISGVILYMFLNNLKTHTFNKPKPNEFKVNPLVDR